MNMHANRPELAADSVSDRLATQERRTAKARQRVRELRQIATAEIERLIAFMDETDGYTTTELEEGHDDEPSLGFQAGDIFVGRGCESGGSWHDDREIEDEHDEDAGDREDDPAERGIGDIDGLMEQVGHGYGEVL